LYPSEEEKDACSRELRRHFDRGRLDERDLVLRLDLVERAVTRGELRRLCADLPADGGHRVRLPSLLRRDG